MPKNHSLWQDKDIDNKFNDFEDAINKEEILHILKVLSYQIKNLSGKDLILMKSYLKKIVKY